MAYYITRLALLPINFEICQFDKLLITCQIRFQNIQINRFKCFYNLNYICFLNERCILFCNAEKVLCCRLYKRKMEECSSNSNPTTYKFVFSFSDSNHLDLQNCWIKFVNRADWIITENSVTCIAHFEDKNLKRGKYIKLNYSKNPILTIITNHNILSKSSLIQSGSAVRKYNHFLMKEMLLLTLIVLQLMETIT